MEPCTCWNAFSLVSSTPRLLYPSGLTSNVTSQKERPSLTTSSHPGTQSFPPPHGEGWPQPQSGPRDFSPLRPLPTFLPFAFVSKAASHLEIRLYPFCCFSCFQIPAFPSHQGRQLLPQGRDTAEGKEEIIHKSFSAFFFFPLSGEFRVISVEEAAGDLRHRGTVLDNGGEKCPLPGLWRNFL